MKRTILILTALMTIVLMSGCGRPEPDTVEQAPPPPTPEELTQQAVDALRAELAQLQTDGQTNAILPRLETALEDPALKDAESLIFSWYIGELVQAQRVDDARAAYLAIASTNAELAQAAFGIIPSMYDREERTEELDEWMNALAALPIVEELRLRTWTAITDLLFSQDRSGEIPARIPEIFESITSDAERLQFVRQVVRNTTRYKAYSSGREILSVVGTQDAVPAPMERLLKTSEVDLLLAEGKIGDAETALWQHCGELTDTDVSPRFRRLMQALLKLEDAAAIDRLANRSIAELADKPGARDTVVSLWVEAAGKSQDKRSFVDRTSQALEAKVQLPRLLNAFEEGFYSIMSSGPDDLKAHCIALMNRMKDAPCDDTHTLARLTLLRLDSAFYRSDFREALTIIEEKIPGRDEAWHEVLINKVSAHLALQENRHEDAIGHFRAHMDTVSEWERPERDPETGVMMTKEAVLGFNEKRIGDIYQSIGKTDKAKLAYAAARNWYEKALTEVEPDSEEHKQYQKEMAVVPTM